MQHSASLMTTDSDEGKVSDNVACCLKLRLLSSKGNNKILVRKNRTQKINRYLLKWF
jgi:hypothetical protein